MSKKETKAKKSTKPEIKSANETTIAEVSVSELREQESDSQAVGDEIKEEKRGRKPKELSIEDVQNDAKELVLNIRKYIKIKESRGKNTNRLRSASNDIDRMIKYQLID